ncbi:unnamed protein product [Dracunculus medinensis]|uniref:G_PROTEIN_RECEP_F1_2 domain-containing protein n=1 Tax=Dracunculus medinensis TaxID=318479 RepID=A0A0N4U1M2_DRAME|nr:unnamed protein product [Dracunculus medinensis]
MRRLISIPWSLFFGCLFVILTTVGLIGNVVVIVAIAGDRKMRQSVMNILLFNLAIADTLNLLTTTIEWVPTIITGTPGWVLPSILCPVGRYLEITFLFVSIMTQLIVCIERYIAIVYPIHARRLCSRRNIFITLIVIWLFVAVFSLPYALLNKKQKSEFMYLFIANTCTNIYINSESWKNYKWIEFANFYFFPCIIFVVLYSKVSMILWSKNRALYKVSSFQMSLRPDALKLRRNVVKMLVACVSVYFICYSPIQAIFLSKALFDIHISPAYEFILLMNAFALTCSACNPLLYTLFSKKFRSRMTKIFQCFQAPIGEKPNDFSNSVSKVIHYFKRMQ